MATRQYIGARYTPKFSGTYDNTQAYEALEVVDNGSGTTYIARKPVPPNTPLTDTEYWLVYGSSSGAILDLQDRMSDAESNITTINGSILSIGGEITGINTDISNVESSITKLQRRTNRKFIFISDSYGHSSGTNNGWIDKLVVKLGLSSNDYYEAALGGAGFAVTTESLKFYTLLSGIAASMTPAQKAEITDIVVLGGANDSGYPVEDMAQFINNFIELANTNFPYAQIHIGMCAGNYANNVIGIQHGRTLDGYLAGNGYSYINNIQYLFHDRSLIGSDHVHPTDTGYDRLANFVYAYLNGGSMSVGYRQTSAVSCTDGTLTGISNAFTIVENAITAVRLDAISAEFTNSKNIGYLHAVNTGININSNLFLGITNRAAGQGFSLTDTTVIASFYSEYDSSWHTMDVTVAIYDGNIWIANVNEANSSGSVELAMRQVKKIALPQFTMVVPSMYC